LRGEVISFLSIKGKEFGVDEKIKSLVECLKDKKSCLNGKHFLKKNSNYETELCQILGFEEKQNRYYDAVWNEIKIEIKKGRSIWLDLLRYGEILLGEGDEDTITLFFISNKERNKVDKILIVETKKIIEKLALDKKYSEMLKSLKNQLPRSFNAQASLTIKDIEKISNEIID